MSMIPPGADADEPVLPPSDTNPTPVSPTPPAAGAPPSAPGAPTPPPAFGSQPPLPAFGTPPRSPAFGAQPPPGYVEYSQGGSYLGSAPLATTVGLRKWVSGLFILVTALTGLATWAEFSRLGVVDDFIDGNASIFDIDDADQLVFATGIFTLIGTLAAAIVLCVWTLRTIRNAEALCGDGLKPKLAAGGWFIPIGNLWISFAKLRQAGGPLHAETRYTSWWQAMWIISVFAGNASLRSDAFDQPTIEGVRDGLSGIATQSAFATVVTALAAFFGIRAMKDYESSIVARQTRDAAK